jgi:dTDP-4-dehydrorhamnose reductase
MNFRLTGSKGILGSALVEVYRSTATPSHIHPLEWQTVLSLPLDTLVEQLRGAAGLFHFAANTDVEQCEIDPDACYRDNYLLTERLAQACVLAGCQMIFASSTGVYGSSQITPYREYDEARPTTHHHRSKLLAEQAVLRASDRNLVIRTGWLFGGPYAARKNFVARRMDELQRAQGPVHSNNQQVGNPTFTNDVARQISYLLEAQVSGVVNVVNEGSASRFQYVNRIAELMGSSVEVKSVQAASFVRKAQVSNNETACNWKMTQLALPAMPSWEASLALYMEALQRADHA